MKSKAGIFLIAMLFAVFGLQAANVVYDVKDFTGTAVIRRAVISPLSAPTIVNGKIVMIEPRVYTNFTAGVFTASNVLGPLAYRAEFYGPYGVTTVTNFIPDTTETINAADYITNAVYINNLTTWTRGAADARYVQQTNGVSTGQTLTNPKFSGTVQLGWIWTSTGTNGAGEWQVAPDGTDYAPIINTASNALQLQIDATAANLVTASNQFRQSGINISNTFASTASLLSTSNALQVKIDTNAANLVIASNQFRQSGINLTNAIALKQDHSANLDGWSALSTNLLTSITNLFSLTGKLVITNNLESPDPSRNYYCILETTTNSLIAGFLHLQGRGPDAEHDIILHVDITASNSTPAMAVSICQFQGAQIGAAIRLFTDINTDTGHVKLWIAPPSLDYALTIETYGDKMPAPSLIEVEEAEYLVGPTTIPGSTVTSFLSTVNGQISAASLQAHKFTLIDGYGNTEDFVKLPSPTADLTSGIGYQLGTPSADIVGRSATISGTTTTVNLFASDTAIEIAAGAAAGTDPSVSVAGGNAVGQITVTAGASPATGDAIVTVTYDTSHPMSAATSTVIVLSPANAAACDLGFVPFVEGSSTGFTVNVAGTALAEAATYKWNYIAIGR